MNSISEVIHGHVSTDLLKDDGRFPNNEHLPLLIYKGVLRLHPDDEPDCILALFEKNGWSNGWKNGIYDYHHYHSNTHEVLGIFCGTAELQLGGPSGTCVELDRGDVIVIPAGVAHKCLKPSNDFLCTGAYPEGRDYDINQGRDGERPLADERIKNVPIPHLDPVFGTEGPLTQHWKQT